jgi:hypothetical protein
MKSENSVLSVEQILRRAGSPGYVESTVAVKSEQLIRKVYIQPRNAGRLPALRRLNEHCIQWQTVRRKNMQGRVN